MSPPKPTSSQYRHFHTPTVIQMEAAECGAAALCSILEYYGSYPSLEEVRTQCAVSRDGVNALNIIRAAESYGLKGVGYSFDLPELYEAPLPLIAHWNFNHFVIIEGFGRDGVYINDPASGPRKISYEDLNNSFSGVALTFTKTEEFKKRPSSDNLWKRVRSRLKLFVSPILFTILMGILAVVPVLALAALSKVFIDHVLLARFDTWEWGVVVGLICLILGGTVIQYLQAWASARFSLQLSTLLSSQFIWHILHLPLSFIFRRYPGEVASRMSLNQAVAETFVESTFGIFVSILFATVFASVMLFYDVPLALVCILLVLANVVLMSYLYRSREDAYANYRQAQGYLSALAISGLENIESIKAIGGEHQFINRYSGLYTKSLNTLQRMLKVDVILGSLSPFFMSFAFITILILGAWRIMQGYLTVGDFFALQILFKNFSDPVMSLINANQTLQLLSINTERLDDVLSYPKDTLRYQEGAENFPHLQGDVKVKNLSFGFHPLDEPFLKNIQFHVKPGSFVAIVGPSGCGKSTLVKLMGRLLNPWNGEIYYDDIPSQEFFQQGSPSSIAFVEQVPMLFTDSIERNIDLLDTSIDHTSVVAAAKDACIHEDIIQRPGGYHSSVNKLGANFSGGQCQRLEIACALARNPTLVILDEATSAVDAPREKEIFNNIRKRGCTLIVITHRMHAVRACDVIFVMNQGQIVDSGTHAELINRSSLYQQLVLAEEVRMS